MNLKEAIKKNIQENTRAFILENIRFLKNTITDLKNRIDENNKLISNYKNTLEIAKSNIILYSTVPEEIAQYFKTERFLNIVKGLWAYNKKNAEISEKNFTIEISNLSKENIKYKKELELSKKELEEFKHIYNDKYDEEITIEYYT